MLLFNKRLDIGDWDVEHMDNCIQMAQIQTFSESGPANQCVCDDEWESDHAEKWLSPRKDTKIVW